MAIKDDDIEDTDIEDAETLVAQCLENHRKKIIFYERTKQNSTLDKAGIDFVIEMFIKKLGRSLRLNFQVKRSENEDTVGFLLPIPPPENLPAKIAAKLTEAKGKIITKHAKRYPKVKHILFVGRLSYKEKGRLVNNVAQEKRRAKVLQEIWHEIKKLFHLTAWREINN